jgi:hypothetical protein
MTWPPRVWLAMGVVVVLIMLLLGVIATPWYRQLPLSRGSRRLMTAAIVVFLLTLLGAVVFLVPAYWD